MSCKSTVFYRCLIFIFTYHIVQVLSRKTFRTIENSNVDLLPAAKQWSSDNWPHTGSISRKEVIFSQYLQCPRNLSSLQYIPVQEEATDGIPIALLIIAMAIHERFNDPGLKFYVYCCIVKFTVKESGCCSSSSPFDSCPVFSMSLALYLLWLSELFYVKLTTDQCSRFYKIYCWVYSWYGW